MFSWRERQDAEQGLQHCRIVSWDLSSLHLTLASCPISLTFGDPRCIDHLPDTLPSPRKID